MMALRAIGRGFSPAKPPHYLPYPAKFDGSNDGLRIASGGLTGAADSKLFTLSFWMRTSTNGTLPFLFAITNADFTHRFFVQLNASNKLTFEGYSSAGTKILDFDGTGPALTDGAWHHVAIAVNLANPASRWVYIDKVSYAGTWTTYTDAAIDFTVPSVTVGAANSFLGNKYNGDMSDLYFKIGTAHDLSASNPFVRGLFPRKPVAVLGSGIVYLYGSPLNWHTNKGTGGGFTENGEITAGTRPVKLAA